MNIRSAILFVFVAIALVGLPMIVATLLRGDSEQFMDSVASVKRPAKSGSGEFLLHVVEPAAGEQRFRICRIGKTPEDKPGIAFESESFRTRDVLYFLWGEGDRVWVYSGDLGTFFWEEEGDGSWKMHTYAEGSVSAPQFLKRMRPKWHPR